MPHVYHGSIWRSTAQQKQLAQVREIIYETSSREQVSDPSQGADADVVAANMRNGGLSSAASSSSASTTAAGSSRGGYPSSSSSPVASAASSSNGHVSSSSSSSSSSAAPVSIAEPMRVQAELWLGSDLWRDILFCYKLWLEYTPHTANWGHCASYGLAPLHLCWHNRWREDLRHAVSDLARKFAAESDVMEPKERSCAACLLATLDHVLSWSVTTLDRGSSDLIDASYWSYPDFCEKLKERFAFAWAIAQTSDLDLAEASVEGEGFDLHLEVMASREVPANFRQIW
eukprot:TRINITY_DN66894_c0_g1_i1.p1 TRINITY_DN66894_c0_g1~~TRINITY_DN66894_c0_g1_i1.p1  ORF type:complete len:287 (+),score=58.17 TRINITY_DN66894_c0_g1_i1:2-862(+)